MSLSHEQIVGMNIVMLPDGTIASVSSDLANLRFIALPGAINPDYANLLASAAVLYTSIDRAIAVMDELVSLCEAQGNDVLAAPFIQTIGGLKTAQLCAVEGTSAVAARIAK